MLRIKDHGLFLDNKGPYAFDMTHEVELISSSAVDDYEPDPEWFSIDSHGHFHAFTPEGDLPTLKVVSEEVHEYWGESNTYSEHRCMICNDAIHPSYRSKSVFNEMVPGRKRSIIHVDDYFVSGSTDLGIGDKLSFYTKDIFGVAVVQHITLEHNRGLKLQLECLFVSQRRNNT